MDFHPFLEVQMLVGDWAQTLVENNRLQIHVAVAAVVLLPTGMAFLQLVTGEVVELE